MTRASLATLVRSLAFAALAISTARADVAPPITMASHHATYRLFLLKAKGAGAPASASGLIDYTFNGSACDGYTTSFRQVTELQPPEGDARVSDMRSTTFEDGTGSQFAFKTTTHNDQEAATDLDGRARKQADGVASVELKQPPGKAALGDNILFPTEHLRRIIQVAESGGKLLEAAVFDGSDTGRKIFRTLSVIGQPITVPSPDPAGQNDVTKGMRRWPVAISYFSAGKEDQPDYVLSFDLYENGISRALRLDYGDFILGGELTDLSVKPQPACH